MVEWLGWERGLRPVLHNMALVRVCRSPILCSIHVPTCLAGDGGVGVFNFLFANILVFRSFDVGNPTLGVVVKVGTHVSEDNVRHMIGHQS